jgi:hypothetical protein
MARTFGLNPEGMTRKVLLTALRNVAKPADEAAIVARVRAEIKAETEREQAVKMGAEIAVRAVKMGMVFASDGERTAFATFAAGNPAAAESVIKSLPNARLMSRVTAGGAPVGANAIESAPAVARPVEMSDHGNVRIMGRGLSDAAKKLLADGKAPDMAAAQMMAIRANPALANE